ncbi:hypothetical protein SAMN04488066_11063 [Halorubrum aquaticum]|uniref:Uncharacterized protein n=1 Tax=Halorubrum aquaticum TaxID=387340 RepID=A0A1I3B8M8_9EURY|nr:hypothetical protein [Halorubrum aquaticum]SFH58416.1 hypothetical protein SAMN04488066_11063 [Halorubrum aquaticum]
MVSDTRLYGAAIAFASGGYSIASAAGATRTTLTAWLMLALGAVVVVHGALLLAPAVPLDDATSGGLMLAYAVVMLANQAALATGMAGGTTGGGTDGGGMTDGSMGGGIGTMGSMGGDATMTAAMPWDLGMAVLALLMLVSGAIMLRSDDGM